MDAVWPLSLLEYSSVGDEPWISVYLVPVESHRHMAHCVPGGTPESNLGYLRLQDGLFPGHAIRVVGCTPVHVLGGAVLELTW